MTDLKIIYCVLQAAGSQSSTTAASGERGGSQVNPLDQLAQSGMGMLHLCAALGYDWAVSQLLAGGANIDQQVGRLHLCQAGAGTELSDSGRHHGPGGGQAACLHRGLDCLPAHGGICQTDMQAGTCTAPAVCIQFLLWCDITGCLGDSASVADLIDVCRLAACLSTMCHRPAQVYQPDSGGTVPVSWHHPAGCHCPAGLAGLQSAALGSNER